ncbi:hypothetical protein HYW73_02245 [Candidatus Nomurabacteria bacterium]|nr:hypothetical protein [Candidatus Nomurabacteria bacterium]
MNQYKTGLALGSFAALVHVVWVLLVALGWAQPWMNFVYGMHLLNNPFVIMPFDLTRAVSVVIIAFIMGNIVGNVFAWIWNKVHN